MSPTIDIKRLHDTLRRCIQVPSPQPDMGKVREFIIEVVRPYLRQLPFDHLDLDSMGNLVAVRKGRSKAAPFLFCTYAGTYPPEGMTNPYDARVVQGEDYGLPPGPYMWGRGTTEQMGALAAALEAVAVHCGKVQSPMRELIFATVVAGEMGCHDAVQHMIEAGNFGFGPTLLAVGTNNSVGIGNMGRVDVHVEITGQACHSSDPSKGRNAIIGACEFVRLLSEMELPEPDPDLGQPTITPTFVTSWPTASHTVPSHCRLVLDRRLIPGEDILAALDDLERCGSHVDGFQVSVKGGRFNYPSKTARSAPLLELALAALKAEGAAARTHFSRSTLDAGFFSRQGVDVIQLGPGDGRMAHTDVEMIALADVELAARVYSRILQAMLNESQAEP